MEDPPRAGTSAAASAQPQEGIEQGECAVAASEKDASEDSDGKCEECGDVPAELCAQCGSVVCVRCGWQGKHSTEAVGQLLSMGYDPNVLGSREGPKRQPVSRC